MKRRESCEIKIGKLKIGGNNPILVQSMIKNRNFNEVIQEIKELERVGCDLIRIAVPGVKELEVIKQIKKITSMPLIADIHHNYKLAIKSVEYGVDEIRINPGNIKGKERVYEIVKCLKEYNVPMRVGVNSGSLEREILEKYKGPTYQALSESLLNWVKRIEDMEFRKLILSAKSSNPITTVKAYKLVANEVNYPLHLGVTATSGGTTGVVKSSIGIGSLLMEGIGDTIRVSLTESSKEEVIVGNEILIALGLKRGIDIISCPGCTRRDIDVENILSVVKKELEGIRFKVNKNIKIAIMGCIVNGPGEAKEADLGITGKGKVGVIFKKGKVMCKIKRETVIPKFLEEIEKLIHYR
jgi:(E)-4-hydroxy-3-methylbut-2-enyl-diphosphate synthase